MALILEGRRHQGSRRRSGGREYRKLDSSLEARLIIGSVLGGLLQLFPLQDSMETGREANLRQVIY